MNKALVGKRVELHPATDRWMMGDRYGTIARVGRTYALVHLDKSGKRIKFHPDDLTLVNDLKRINAPTLAQLCRCGHPEHASQCPNPTGCWCDTFTH